MKTTLDEALMKAVDEVAMKEKVGKVRRCVDQFDVFVNSVFAWKMSQRQQSNQFLLAMGATGNSVAGPPLAAVSEPMRPAHPA
jgi:L-rhamnose isomerase